MSSLPPLAIDTYNFATLRQEGQVYVDKTAYIQRMLEARMRYVFLARPRRFGKSLLVSTLAHLFAREADDLFHGLDIATSGYLAHVPRVPVLVLNMARVEGDTPSEVRGELTRMVRDLSLPFGLDTSAQTPPWGALDSLFSCLHRRYGKFAVLVDEYDAPLTNTLVNPLFEQSDKQQVQSQMRHFYRTLKNWDHAMQFVFVTGILDMGGSGLFSALNNLRYLSDDARFKALCGFTEAEVDVFLRPHVEEAARNLGCSPDAMHEQLRMHYNGYRFTVHGESLYNPISCLTALDQLTTPQNAQEIVHAGFPRPWVRTGQTHFLFQYIQARGKALTDVDFSVAGAKDALDLHKPSLNALMFQSGFVTLQRVPRRNGDGFPELGSGNRIPGRACFSTVSAHSQDRTAACENLCAKWRRP